MRHGGAWRALNSNGDCLAEAPTVVVAGAFGSLALLAEASGPMSAEALPLRPVKGQMSLAALEGPPLAQRPQRDDGVFVPCYEDDGLSPPWPARIWSMGSTYERGENSTHLSAEAHERNAASLETLCAPAASGLREAASQGSLLGWAQVRCASLDRLPLVGAVPDGEALRALMAQAGPRRGRVPLADTPRHAGLFMLSALGSRGITLAPWCASRLAAEMDGDAGSEGEADLLRAIDPARFAWKQARRQS